VSEPGGVTGNDAIGHAWIEISFGIAVAVTTVRWYAEYCTAESRSIVADRRTEHEAISAGRSRVGQRSDMTTNYRPGCAGSEV
jgi:hypothetical protein